MNAFIKLATATRGPKRTHVRPLMEGIQPMRRKDHS